MTLPEKPGWAISSGLHAALVAAALISFSSASRFDDAQETIPVDMVSDQEFNHIMKGEKTATLKPKPLTRVEKLAPVSETKPRPATAEAKTDAPAPPARAKQEQDPGVDEPREKPTPPERTAALPPARPALPPPPPPKAAPEESPDALEPKPIARPKVEPKVSAKPTAEQKPVEKPRKTEPKFKPDQLAKLVEEDKRKEVVRKVEERPVPKPKSGEESAEPQKFDPSDISRFLNKETPQRKASTGRELQQEASLGAPTATAAKMSPSLWGQLDGLMQEQYKRCWNFIGLGGQQKYVPEIHVHFAQDGSLIGEPALLNPPSDPNLRNLADSALRAVRRCNPLHIPAQYQPYYDQWKGRVVRFDPEDML